MTTESLITLMNEIGNGSWFKIKWTSDVPLTAAARKSGIQVFKNTEAQCRKGIAYANQKSVKEKVDAGKVLQGLPWGTWKEGHEGLLIEHKGNDYVRLYLGPNVPHSTYTVLKQSADGMTEEKMTKEQLVASGYVLPSWANKKSEKPEALTVKVDNVLAIKGQLE